MTSEIIKLKVTNSKNEQESGFTFKEYYEQQNIQAIQKYKRNLDAMVYLTSTFVGMAAYYISKNRKEKIYSFKFSQMPFKNTINGFLAFSVTYLISDVYRVKMLTKYQGDLALKCKGLPVWKESNHTTGLEKAQFQLIQTKNDEISVKHSNLTPQTAAKMMPDTIIGSAHHTSDNQ